MDFNKRHHPHQGYHFNPNPRPSNPGNGVVHSGFQPVPFVAHHPHPPHNSRAFKPNEGHNNNGAKLNLTFSFRNLMKMQSEMVAERSGCFQKLSQLRDLMLSRVSSNVNNLVKDEMFESMITEIKEIVAKKDEAPGEVDGTNGSTRDGIDEAGIVAAKEEDHQRFQMPTSTSTVTIEDLKNRLRGRLHETLNGVLEETVHYANRENNLMLGLCTKEKRVEKDFLEFFNEAERQIIEYEKKFRSDQYGQMVTRLRNAEREIALRDQKIMQLEDTLKIVGDRSEKYMAELQQVNADHQFEKLQLYHHVEVCKFNAKCMATEELSRICKWKRCTCGRDYSDLFREIEGSFNLVYNHNGTIQQHDCFALGGRCKDMPDRREMSCTSSWTFPTGHSHMAPNQPIPAGSFIPSEEAATKGTVLNDLRDRYDELQLKAAVIPNYEEMRRMMMKIVCHFKTGGLRVCEEMRGKQFLSSLFYCNSEDLVPNKTDKVFSTGCGDTPEEATQKSVQQALYAIENMNDPNKGIEMAFVRRNPVDSVLGKLDKEAIRMTLLRSYCKEKIDPEASDDVRCVQEAHLYQNHANATEKYMADWKIHIRVEDENENGIKDKLKRVLRSIKNSHVSEFVEHRPLIKEKIMK